MNAPQRAGFDYPLQHRALGTVLLISRAKGTRSNSTSLRAHGQMQTANCNFHMAEVSKEFIRVQKIFQQRLLQGPPINNFRSSLQLKFSLEQAA